MTARKPLTERKRRPTKLVKTVNLLARVKGELERTDEQHQRLTNALDPLRRRLAEAQQQLDVAQAAADKSAHRQAELKQLEDVLSKELRAVDPRLDGSATKPVRAMAGGYGSFGGLRQTLLDLLVADGGWISTPQLGHIVAAAMNLTFDTPMAAKKWRTDSVGRTLRELLDDGKVSRHKPGHVQDEVFWRIKVDRTAKSLDELRAQVEALLNAPPDVSEADGSTVA